MSWVIGALALTLGVVCAWGLIAPRGQWRVLMGWSVRDIHADEPSGVAYGVRRLISGLGLLGLLTVVVLSTNPGSLTPGPTAAPPSVVAQMWGSPEPDVVNRIIRPLGAAPGGLVEVAALGYQAFDEDIPDYVSRLDEFSILGNRSVPGYVGTLPPVGNAAIDFADMVVHVHGAILCVPRQVVVVETADQIQVGVFYGVPDGSTLVTETDCAADATLTGSALIPLQLAAPVGDRLVVGLDGEEIEEIPLIE